MQLSVCLIVKDEEPVLARCLTCASKIADELIIVDTGSSDSSVKIAKKFTDKVYQIKGENSFCKARNYSYSKATCDYIMWLDADDIITEDNIKKINLFKKEAKPDVDVVFMLYDSGKKDVPSIYILRDRIIKKSLNAKGVCDIHESLKINRSGNIVHLPDISITHKKEYVNDKNRNINIFNELVENNHKFNIFEICNYCKELTVHDKHEKSIEVFEKHRDNMHSSDYYYALYFVKNSYLNQKKYTDLFAEITRMNKKVETSALMIYYLGFCQEMLKNYSQAEEYYKKAMTIPENPLTLYIQETGYTDYFPYLGLARLEQARGNKKESLNLIDKASQIFSKDNMWQLQKMNLLFSSDS